MIHYFKSGKKAYVIISATCQPIGQKIEVSGKKEAKELAKTLGLKPWNF